MCHAVKMGYIFGSHACWKVGGLHIVPSPNHHKSQPRTNTGSILVKTAYHWNSSRSCNGNEDYLMPHTTRGLNLYNYRCYCIYHLKFSSLTCQSTGRRMPAHHIGLFPSRTYGHTVECSISFQERHTHALSSQWVTAYSFFESELRIL